MNHRSPEHMRQIGANCVELRQAKAAIRRGLRLGTLDLTEVLADPDECLNGMLVSDLMVLVRGMSKYKMTALNRRAMSSGINLMVRVERASPRTRAWVALNVTAERSGSRARTNHSGLISAGGFPKATA